MRFTKMQGTGNDYIYLDCMSGIPTDLSDLARKLSRPHFSVGSDGLIGVCPSDKADFSMRMFNADGSEGEMCGNGLRCVCKYVYDKGLTRKTALAIETRSGVRYAVLHVAEGMVETVTVDMGEPRLASPRRLEIQGMEYEVIPVSMGNPHLVTFVDSLGELDLTAQGPDFEYHPSFLPERVNTEFVQIISLDHISMRVWERGSGETLACGTGACAALAAAAWSGRSERCAVITLSGGDLEVYWDEKDGHIYMTGPAVTVFEGEINL